MSDIINVLPDSVSTKIAAGEVIQRPSSVVKELLENSVDAKSTEIILKVVDAGKSLIQVIDNGVGMSAKDIVMCLKKHSTSKIKAFDDLFLLTTMGFRGEAIASIVAVSDLEISSSVSDTFLGKKITVHDSVIVSNEDVLCKKGTIVTVKNLFYNIPARLAFLKDNYSELNYIIREFLRISLANPGISFKFISEDELKYDFSASSLLKRISDVFKNKNKSNLIYFSGDSGDISISGYMINPVQARKNDDIYVYVNGRYVVDSGIKSQIISAYGNVINGKKPFCLLNININSSCVDVNISPSKTEVKFKNEQFVYSLIHNVIRKKLFYCEVPDLSFDSFDSILSDDVSVVDSGSTSVCQNEKMELFNTVETYDSNVSVNSANLILIDGSHIISRVKSGIIVINVVRALRRINYDKISSDFERGNICSQQLLFPSSFVFSTEDIDLLKKNRSVLDKLGFTVVFDLSCVVVTGIPSFVDVKNLNDTLELIIETLKSGDSVGMYDIIIKGIIKMENSVLSDLKSAMSLINNLFMFDSNMYDPFGKRIFVILDSCSLDDIIDS